MGEWIEWKGGDEVIVPFVGDERLMIRWTDGNETGPHRANAICGWSMGVIRAYRLAEPEQTAEHAHMMASPTTGSSQGMLDISFDAPTRQHVSDAAMEYAREMFPQLGDDEILSILNHPDTVLLTVAEHDALLALRAEVERLRVQLAGCDVASRANTRQSLDEAKALEPYSYGWSPAYESVLEAVAREIALREDNERLRKGRDDGKIADADCVVHGRNTLGLQLSYGGTVSLDHRLGTQLPDGEPVGPRPMRRWMP